MRNSSDSWWLKIKRAEAHAKEIEGLVAPFNVIRPYAVSRTIEGKPEQYVYRGWDDTELDEWIPVVMGDFLHDVRSALDHMRAALVPNNRKSRGYFPIFTEDFDAEGPPVLCPECGQNLKGEQSASARWSTYTRGMDPVGCRLPVRESAVPRPERNPSHHTLAIVGSLNNADKHKDLVATIRGLKVDAEYASSIQTAESKATGPQTLLRMAQ